MFSNMNKKANLTDDHKETIAIAFVYPTEVNLQQFIPILCGQLVFPQLVSDHCQASNSGHLLKYF